jgi:hypothetical protein
VTTEEQDLIVSYATETPQRLRVAILLGTAYPKIRNKLLKDKLTSLQTRLQAAIGDEWFFAKGAEDKSAVRAGSRRKWSPEFTGAFSFLFRKHNWPETFFIGFGRDGSGQVLQFMVERWDKKSHQPIDADLHSALERGLAPGEQGNWCSWYKSLDRYAHWDTDEDLTELIQGDEPVEYLAGRLLQIRAITEPIIDAAVRRSGQAEPPSVKPEGT